MQLSLTKYPALVLRKKARKVKKVTDEVCATLRDMEHAMRKNQGVGLAAPQIGIDLQLAVVDVGDGVVNLINPRIIKKCGADTMDEGCLSVPITLVRVKRAKTVTVEYLDTSGNRVKNNFCGLAAKAIQHEVDHLNGKLIIDYLPWYKRVFVKTRLS